MTDRSNLESRCINAIRFLAADAVDKAKSGHPGLPMGAAPMGFVLWDRFMRHNPKSPGWFNRDRFVLSAGHGSMLQYALLHLTGYDISIEDIKAFRQWGAKTPGHPENGVTPGVEVTTGPLGQGIANAVGMAISAKHLAARFNKPGCKVVDHNIYVLMGDGCQMEGISSEACSLAGHLGLGNLVALYDDNKITIDGPTDLTFSEDVPARFESYGWQVLVVERGNTDLEEIAAAIEAARAETARPSLICVRTTIGYGSPHKAGSSSTHGAPLGADENQATRKNLGWDAAPFEVPESVYTHMRKATDRGAALEEAWNKTLDAYRDEYPNEAALFEELISGELPDGYAQALPALGDEAHPAATRVLSGKCLNALADELPGLIGGSADLTPSNNTALKSSLAISKDDFSQRYIHFGVREHAMGAICNGIALHGSGLIPYCGTFLSFADYMRGAIRLSALSHAGVIYVMTHDSIAVGEDGPTHQPVEHIASLRAIPGLDVFRPADGREVAGAYHAAVERRDGPTLLALSRQSVPSLDGTSAEKAMKGGYVVRDCGGQPAMILIGTGSELSLCVAAAEELEREGVSVRVVSMPCWERFERQDPHYREAVLPKAVTCRVAVEAGSGFGWERYTGSAGAAVTIDRFGTSAPGDVCMENFGFTVANVVQTARGLVS